MNRTSLITPGLVICLAASMVATVGCASKNYVKQQTTPLINKTNELDDLTAKNTKDIKDVDARAQAGIAAVNAKTVEVEQKAQTADQNAVSAQQVADAANARVGVLTDTVANLDNYHAVAETSVKFGFNRDNLTPKAKEALDQLAGSLSTTKGYIVALRSEPRQLSRCGGDVGEVRFQPRQPYAQGQGSARPTGGQPVHDQGLHRGAQI